MKNKNLKFKWYMNNNAPNASNYSLKLIPLLSGSKQAHLKDTRKFKNNENL